MQSPKGNTADFARAALVSKETAPSLSSTYLLLTAFKTSNVLPTTASQHQITPPPRLYRFTWLATALGTRHGIVLQAASKTASLLGRCADEAAKCTFLSRPSLAYEIYLLPHCRRFDVSVCTLRRRQYDVYLTAKRPIRPYSAQYKKSGGDTCSNVLTAAVQSSQSLHQRQHFVAAPPPCAFVMPPSP